VPRAKPSDDSSLIDANAERAVLAIVKLDPSKAHVLDELSTREFGQPEHRFLFDSMKRLRERSVALDEITIADELRALGRLEDVGGMAYLYGLELDLPAVSGLDSYLSILREKRLRRDARKLLDTAHGSLLREGKPSVEQLRALREDLLELEIDASADSYEEWGALLRSSVEAAEGPIPPGLAALVDRTFRKF